MEKAKHPDVIFVWKFSHSGKWKRVPALKKNSVDEGRKQAERHNINRTIYDCEDKK